MSQRDLQITFKDIHVFCTIVILLRIINRLLNAVLKSDL